MTPEQWIALLGALTALFVAISAAIIQIRGLRSDINGHVTRLVATATALGEKQGELQGRDFMHRLLTAPPEGAEGSTPSEPAR